MDIEEYLKQKKELEAKKDILEAKEKLKREKERVRPREEEGVKGEPLLKPWMIWDIIMLLVVVGLFSTAYFYPREQVSTEEIEDLVDEKIEDVDQKIGEVERNLIAAMATRNVDGDEGVVEVGGNEEDVDEGEGIEEKQPGPKFNLFLKDLDLGVFDEDGKIDSEILLISGASLYEYSLVVENKENKNILCKVDEEISRDSDFDGEVDDVKTKDELHLLKFDPFEVEELPDSAAGYGEIVGKYEARCYFCLDRQCDSPAQYTEEVAEAMFKVRILIDGSDGNSS